MRTQSGRLYPVHQQAEFQPLGRSQAHQALSPSCLIGPSWIVLAFGSHSCLSNGRTMASFSASDMPMRSTSCDVLLDVVRVRDRIAQRLCHLPAGSPHYESRTLGPRAKWSGVCLSA